MKVRSLPTRGEWIEMFQARCSWKDEYKSLPTRGEWIEIHNLAALSLPRGLFPHGESGLKSL